jgi:hypothetical protein
MSFMSLLYGEHRKRIQDQHTMPDMSHMRHMNAPMAYQVDFYLIYVTIGVPGFKMSWTTLPKASSGSDLCLAREFSTVLTSSAATRVVHWAR